MAKHGTDQLFGGSIPLLYETHLVPLIFEPYARDLARTLAARALSNVLEVAAGTGVVTRALDATLPDHVAITATDLNQPMLDQAATVGTKRTVQWQQADAMQNIDPAAPLYVMLNAVGVYVQSGMNWQQVPSSPGAPKP